MAHTYDLLLQASAPGEAAPVAALVGALGARGATLSPEGRGTWKLNDGEVTIEPLFEEGQVKGLDVRVPIEHAQRLREALLKRHASLTWIEYENEGHGWYKPQTRFDFYRQMEAFLKANIGPDAPTASP